MDRRCASAAIKVTITLTIAPFRGQQTDRALFVNVSNMKEYHMKITEDMKTAAIFIAGFILIGLGAQIVAALVYVPGIAVVITGIVKFAKDHNPNQ